MKRATLWITNPARVLYLLTVIIGLSLPPSLPVRAQLPVEALIAHIFNRKDTVPYELTANFRGGFSLTTGVGSVAGMAAGSFRE